MNLRHERMSLTVSKAIATGRPLGSANIGYQSNSRMIGQFELPATIFLVLSMTLWW